MLYSDSWRPHLGPCSFRSFWVSFAYLPIGIDSASGLQFCDESAGTTMPERLCDLLERLAGADSFARMPDNLAESPVNRNGRILRNLERGQAERRRILQRRILGPLGILGACLETNGYASSRRRTFLALPSCRRR